MRREDPRPELENWPTPGHNAGGDFLRLDATDEESRAFPEGAVQQPRRTALANAELVNRRTER
jgi:hypothetical protein